MEERTLPPGSARDELDELRAEIATIDTWVAGMLVPYVEHGKKHPLKVDVQGGIDRARQQVNELKRSAHEDDAALLARYEHYLELLDDAFHAFMAE